MNNNPLYTAQREKAGAQTFKKYMYQYHWALYRILKEYNNDKEYAIFVELHEDVVLANSFDVDKVKFEFNQVKTDKSKFTLNKLTKQKKGSSVLGKLVQSTMCQNYSKHITSINLVATNGFSLTPKNKELEHNTLSVNDIDINDLKTLSDAIISELSENKFPINIHFIIPQLPEKSTEEVIIGQIASIVSKLFPDSKTKADSIYRSLIDELTRKGSVTLDFKNWDELLDKKALTSITVSQVINRFTSRQNDEQIYKKFDDYLTDLGLNTLSKRKWDKSFKKYYLQSIANKNIQQLDIKKELLKVIECNEDKCNNEISILLELCLESLSKNISNKFTDEIDIKTAILCELILQD
jgi:hypothetical protein